MAFSDKLDGVFGPVPWTGGSSIHCSIARGGYLDAGFGNPELVLYLLHQYETGGKIWDFLHGFFGPMEWLSDRDGFIKLFLVDMNRLLHGKGTLETKDRLKNPATGNLFHRIALKPPYVGGVRFWCENVGAERVVIGFRFRIVELNGQGEEVKVREESRVREIEVNGEVEEVWDSIMEVSEPPQESVESALKLLVQE